MRLVHYYSVLFFLFWLVEDVCKAEEQTISPRSDVTCLPPGPPPFLAPFPSISLVKSSFAPSHNLPLACQAN